MGNFNLCSRSLASVALVAGDARLLMRRDQLLLVVVVQLRVLGKERGILMAACAAIFRRLCANGKQHRQRDHNKSELESTRRHTWFVAKAAPFSHYGYYLSIEHAVRLRKTRIPSSALLEYYASESDELHSLIDWNYLARA
jgi:hypothetical protein